MQFILQTSIYLNTSQVNGKLTLNQSHGIAVLKTITSRLYDVTALKKNVLSSTNLNMIFMLIIDKSTFAKDNLCSIMIQASQCHG